MQQGLQNWDNIAISRKRKWLGLEKRIFGEHACVEMERFQHIMHRNITRNTMGERLTTTALYRKVLGGLYWMVSSRWSRR